MLNNIDVWNGWLIIEKDKAPEQKGLIMPKEQNNNEGTIVKVSGFIQPKEAISKLMGKRVCFAELDEFKIYTINIEGKDYLAMRPDNIIFNYCGDEDEEKKQ